MSKDLVIREYYNPTFKFYYFRTKIVNIYMTTFIPIMSVLSVIPILNTISEDPNFLQLLKIGLGK